MKKLYRITRALFLVALVSPLGLAWLPPDRLQLRLDPAFQAVLQSSFRPLSATLAATLTLAALLTVALGYVSVLSQRFGRTGASILEAVESAPAFLVALFCYAPVSGYLARHSSGASQVMSLIVFIRAATLTMLPEAVRGVAIPLGDLYHRKYSLSFRSYGFTKRRILAVLMGSHVMRGTLKRIAAGRPPKTTPPG